MDYRVEVKNEDEAKFFQDFCFDNGYEWYLGKKKYQHLDKTFFNMWEETYIQYGYEFHNHVIDSTHKTKILKKNKLNNKLHNKVLFENQKYILIKDEYEKNN